MVSMLKMKLLGNPEIQEKEIPEEGKYFEIEWEFEESPTEKELNGFNNLIKPFLEEPNELFGPYKPQIFNFLFVTTLSDKSLVDKQKEFFEKNFFNKIEKN